MYSSNYPNRPHKFTHHREQGQGLIEYTLLLTLVGVALILSLAAFGGAFSNTMDEVACEMGQGDGCGCTFNEQLMYYSTYVCQSNKLMFQAVTTCDPDQTNLSLQISGQPETAMSFDNTEGLFVASINDPGGKLCGDIEGGLAPPTFIISRHTEEDIIRQFTFDYYNEVSGGGGEEGEGSSESSSPPDNNAPIITVTGASTIPEGDSGVLAIDTTDADGDPVTLSIGTIPSFMIFVDNGDGSANLSVATSSGDAGSYSVVITAEDDQGGVTNRTILVTVGTSNAPPVIDAISDQSIMEGDALTININYTDPDKKDSHSMTVAGIDSGFMNFYPSQDKLILTPGVGDDGSYPLTVTVTDSAGNADSESFTITVTQDTTNYPPTMDNLGTYTLSEGTSKQVDFTASDPNGGSLTFGITGNPSFVTLSTLNGTSARLTISPGYSHEGDYTFTVSVSDGNTIVDQTVNVTVNHVNQPPILSTIGDQSVDEEKTLTLTFNGTDDDGDAITYTVIGVAPSFMTYNDITRTLTISPTMTDSGSYPMSVSIDDGNGGSDFESFTVTVNNMADDTDGDTIMDAEDNCVFDQNTNQSDSDNDGVGDVCDRAYYINLGTDTPWTDSSGQTWQGELVMDIVTKTNNGSTTSDVKNTSDDALYQTWIYRTSNTITLRKFNLPQGTYTVRLYFVETESNSKNWSKFTIEIEGKRVSSKKGYSPGKDVGSFTAATQTYNNVKVGADGQLEILLKPKSGNPIISAVEIWGN